MSLRIRLVLVLVAVTIGVLGIMTAAWSYRQQTWLDENQREYERWIYTYPMGSVYREAGLEAGVLADRTVRRILQPEMRRRLRDYFRDALITSGPTPQAAVDLNPFGAMRRDPATFPTSEVRAGIREAMENRRLVRAAGGFCVAIVDLAAGRERVIGGAWFVPKLPPPSQIPPQVFLWPLVGGALMLCVLIYWLVGRWLIAPLRDAGDAAARFGPENYEVRLASVDSSELQVFVDAFNAMAEQIEGHHAELAREVKRATDEAQKKERALLQSARLASMGTLAAGIAHEINNPIGGMQNAVRRLTKNEELGERDRLYLELIQDGLERVGKIARRVLDFSPKDIEPVPYAVLDAVRGALALVEHRVQREATEVRIDVPDDLPTLRGDRNGIQQVLLNLFINSLDVLEGRDEPRQLVIEARVVDDGVQIDVSDNGPGMDPDLLPRVMDPFFSGKGRPDSSGLGMFISYSIVRDHGGEMEVESEPERGFRTRLWLPIPS